MTEGIQDSVLWTQADPLQDQNGELVSYLASALGLAAFPMRSFVPLRTTAILNNVAFIIYAAAADMRLILIFHSILLPLNVLRLLQFRAERARQARQSYSAMLLNDLSDRLPGLHQSNTPVDGRKVFASPAAGWTGDAAKQTASTDRPKYGPIQPSPRIR